MDVLHAPWRMNYISSSKDANQNNCIFCDYSASTDDAENLIVARGITCFVLLNRYPYSNGHLMIVPYRHTADIGALDDDEKLELLTLSQKAIGTLKIIMNPDGFNLGINLGKAAGAGIDAHMHVHVVPRWNGDTNFMSVTAETKVLPEALSVTRSKLAEVWN
jgi:ATP adenylyltransferase